MFARSSRLVAALLLTIAVGVQVLEASGRWDATLADANDEAGLIAVVLCVGIAVATAATRLARARPVRIPLGTIAAKPPAAERRRAVLIGACSRDGSPPAALRI